MARLPQLTLIAALLIAACDDAQLSSGSDAAGDNGTADSGGDAADAAADLGADQGDVQADAADTSDAADGLPEDSADAAGDAGSDVPAEDVGADAAGDADAADSPDLPAEDLSGDGSLSEGQCHTSEDCDSLLHCLPPGEFPGCGIPHAPDPDSLCDVDGDCGEDRICEMSPPSACFEVPALICQPACLGEGDCAVNEFCAPSGRCVPDVCLQGGADECPEHFECRIGDGFEEGNPRCLRALCEEQADCPGGHCVEGHCYEEPGACVAPVE